MTRKIDNRISNALVEYKDNDINFGALDALIEFLETIENENSNNPVVLLSSKDKNGGIGSNGNIGKGKKQKRND